MGCRGARDKGKGERLGDYSFMRLFRTAGMTVMRSLRHADASMGWQVYELKGGVLVG